MILPTAEEGIMDNFKKLMILLTIFVGLAGCAQTPPVSPPDNDSWHAVSGGGGGGGGK
jgi:hypothetical protein